MSRFIFHEFADVKQVLPKGKTVFLLYLNFHEIRLIEKLQNNFLFKQKFAQERNLIRKKIMK